MAKATRGSKRAIQLSDPKALRAVAHPIRVELLGLLRRVGPLTATQAAERIGEVPASCSFHLRQLAKYGLVEEAGGGRGRERPWRATAISTEWSARGEDAASDAAGAMLTRVVLERYFENAIEWVERQPAEPREWVESASIGDAAVHMTAAELREVEANFRALVEPYLQRLEAGEEPPAGSRPVHLISLAFPMPEESPGG